MKLIANFIVVTLLLQLSTIQCRKRKRRLSEMDEISQDTSKLRYVAFGTSLTYGSTLQNHTTQSYPYLLSSTSSTNLAMPASDARYAAACVQTMLGSEDKNNNKIYDVILIEYDRRQYEYLRILVQRLRNRFPDSIIILTGMWNLMDIMVYSKRDNKEYVLRQALATYVDAKHVSYSNQEAFEATLKLLGNSDYEFRMHEKIKEKNLILNSIAQEFNAHVYTWENEMELKRLLPLVFLLFADYVHLNEGGHRIVSIRLRDLIKEILSTSNNPNYQKSPPTLGSWGDGDFCSNWYEAGQVDLNPKGRESIDTSKYPIEKFEFKKGKYAMHLKDPISVVNVENPFEKQVNIYIIFMSTFPNRLYPKTKVTLSERKDEDEGILIDPMASYNYPVHIQDTKLIGPLEPGMNAIIFEALEKTEFPFRLVGFAITNIDFSPNFFHFWPGPKGVIYNLDKQ